MKKIIPILLAFVLVFLLAACGGGVSSAEDLIDILQDNYNSDNPSKDDFAKISFAYNFEKNDAVKEKMLEEIAGNPYFDEDDKKIYGDDVKCEMKILGSESYSSDKLVSTIKTLSSEYDTADIKDIKTVKYEMKIIGSKKTDNFGTSSITAIQVGSSWYLLEG